MSDSKLKIDIRRDRILERLRAEGRVFVADLSRDLHVTPVTVRTDLSALEREGYLCRVQGGALLKSRTQDTPSGGIRDIEKQAIAETASGLILDGSTLFVNSGTTTHCLAANLKKHKNLNVVTSSLAVATELGNMPTIHVILLGGEINVQYGFTFGEDAQAQLLRYRADWAVLSVDGISASGGITTFHAEEASVNRLMMEHSKNIMIVADHTKIGRAGFTKLHDIDSSVQLVTDENCDHAALAEMTELGLRTIISPVD